MDGFQGAVLAVKLKYIEGWNEARRTVAARYHDLFAKTGLAEAGFIRNTGCFAARDAGQQARVAPVRDSVCAAGRAARISDFAQDRLGDLLSCAASFAGCAEGLDTGRVIFRSGAAAREVLALRFSRSCGRMSRRRVVGDCGVSELRRGRTSRDWGWLGFVSHFPESDLDPRTKTFPWDLGTCRPLITKGRDERAQLLMAHGVFRV